MAAGARPAWPLSGGTLAHQVPAPRIFSPYCPTLSPSPLSSPLPALALLFRQHTQPIPPHSKMIKPITGTLKRRIIIDITVGFAIGGAMAGGWWWGFHKPMVAKRDAWYIENDKAKSA